MSGLDRVKSASEALFYANAKRGDSFNVRVGPAAYTVNIECYVHDDDHYVPLEEMEKIRPIIEALGVPSFLDEKGFLYKQSKMQGAALEKAVGAVNRSQRNGMKNFVGNCNSSSDKYKGIRPFVNILAAVADCVQCDKKDMNEKEKEFWRQHIQCVKNDLGVADKIRFTERSRRYGSKLTENIIIPDKFYPYEPPKLTNQKEPL